MFAFNIEQFIGHLIKMHTYASRVRDTRNISIWSPVKLHVILLNVVNPRISSLVTFTNFAMSQEYCICFSPGVQDINESRVPFCCSLTGHGAQ